MINNPVQENIRPAKAPFGMQPARKVSSVGQKRKTGMSFVEHAIAHSVLLFLAIPALLPLAWMVATSLKSDNQIFATSAKFSLAAFIPHPIAWKNYPLAVHAAPFGTYLENTLFLCVITVIGAVLSSSLVAYGFARLDFPGKNIFFMLMISTMAIPPQVTMIPVFAMFRWLHWYGTYLPLIVQPFCGVPFYIFLLTQFYRNLPAELSEAARIDGAGEFRIFWQVILPLSKPALATCALFQFIGTWNDFIGPLIYINDPMRYTLAYGLQQLVSTHGGEWASLMADSTLFILPIIILFFFTQKSFVSGIATTGSKN